MNISFNFFPLYINMLLIFIVKIQFLKNKVAFSTQGCSLGDRPIRSPQLSNRHMSFSLPLGPPVLWHPFLHNTKSGTPIHGGCRSLGERDGHMAPPSFHRPTHLFQEKTDRDRYMELGYGKVMKILIQKEWGLEYNYYDFNQRFCSDPITEVGEGRGQVPSSKCS